MEMTSVIVIWILFALVNVAVLFLTFRAYKRKEKFCLDVFGRVMGPGCERVRFWEFYKPASIARGRYRDREINMMVLTHGGMLLRSPAPTTGAHWFVRGNWRVEKIELDFKDMETSIARCEAGLEKLFISSD